MNFKGQTASLWSLGIIVAIALSVVTVIGIATGMIGAGAIPFQAIPTDPTSNSTANSSLEVTLTDPVTRTLVDGTIELYKVNGDGTLKFAKSSTTTSGTVSLSNLSPSQNYVIEATPASVTWWYPMEISGSDTKTLSAGSKEVLIEVSSQNNTVADFSVFNHDNRTANTTSARQALSATDTKRFNVTLQPAASTNDNNFIGDGVLGNLFIIDVNREIIQSISASDAIGAMNCGVGVPTGHSYFDANKTKSYACVSNYSRLYSNETYDFVFEFTTTTVEPRGGSLDVNGAMTVRFYDSCRVLNTQTGNYEEDWFNPVTLTDLCTTTVNQFDLLYS